MKQRLHPDDLEFYLKSNEKRLYRLAYSYMHSDADAKDMLQNAILKAFTGLTRLKKHGVYGYLVLQNSHQYLSGSNP